MIKGVGIAPNIAWEKENAIMDHYDITVAGVKRSLPVVPISDTMSIASFVIFGDTDVVEPCARELAAKLPPLDYLITAEAKSIPLIHEMARQSGAKKYFIARKGSKVYMPDPIHVSVRSITTLRTQDLFLGSDDCALIRGKRILIVDDVISTGESLHALEELVKTAGGTVTGRAAILAEGDALARKDITYLAPLPVFNADGTVKE